MEKQDSVTGESNESEYSKQGNSMDILNKFFGVNHTIQQSMHDGETPEDILVATCALFIEMAGIDGQFSDEERETILNILTEEYRLSKEHASEITSISKKRLEDSLDLWQFTNLINQNYSSEEKARIIELIWKIIYTDGNLNKYEDYLVHKLAGLLNLSHRDLIGAKLKVLHHSED